MAEMNAPWMRVARALEGEAELAGKASNPRIVEMFRIAELPDDPAFKKDETAWCAAFANACLRCAGYAGTKSALASSFSRFGNDLGRTPQDGCVVLFHPLSAGASGHVGFYVGEDAQHIRVLGGNQSDKVKVEEFPKGKWRAYRWPSQIAPLPASTSLPTILALAPNEAPDHVLAPGAAAASVATVIKPVPADNFLRVQPLIEEFEGGFSDHPADPGGATNMGITQETLRRFRKRDITKDDVRALTREEAREIYRAFYWQPLRCDEMPIALALMTYNAGVNSGIGRGARWLQQALNRQGAGLDGDGEVGPLTLSACASTDVARAVNDFADIQERFLRGLKTFATFGRGWMNRLNNAKGKALAVASEPVVVSDGARPPLPPVEPPPQQIESIFDRLIAFLRETSMTATPVPLPPATIPIPSVQPGATSGTQRAAEIAAIFAQLANVLSGQRAVAPTGEQPAVVPTTAPTATTPVATTPAATTPPVLSPIDNILGGQVLAGKKTALAVLAYVIMAILQAVGVAGTATGPTATPTGQILTTLIGGFGAMGLLGKVDRVTNILGLIARRPR
jgi:uncharacterized protein (TIGR02594 family)